MNESPNPMTTRIVWAALLMSQLVYFGLALSVSVAADGAPAVFAIALGAVAVSEAIGVIVFFRLVAVARIQRGALDPATPEGAGQLFVVLVVCWALAESIAIYGLVLRFLGGSIVDTAGFAIGGFVLMALTHPWQSGLRPPVSSSARGEDPTPIV